MLDFACVFLLLIGNALETLAAKVPHPPVPAGIPLWDPKAYHFVHGAGIFFHNLQAVLTPALHRHGVIPFDEIRAVAILKLHGFCLLGNRRSTRMRRPADSWVMHLATWFAINMRVRATRLEALGWKPRDGSVLEGQGEPFRRFLEWEAGSTQ